ncbi:hypothetical protein L5G28_03785 [Gordonia sp. HY285]|uniref:hypothetical protein n=1 Tax=Gordonia liuliyuniae TaxID=2911517 RepID=UPI001F1997E7|nr:hypothetical protein [Gordonia liuliyuniae]MCF8609284.1 hypothetical protein [Gordonia liuliyuniae]
MQSSLRLGSRPRLPEGDEVRSRVDDSVEKLCRTNDLTVVGAVGSLLAALLIASATRPGAIVEP